jgi:hypothetical protein
MDMRSFDKVLSKPLEYKFKCRSILMFLMKPRWMVINENRRLEEI